MSCGSTSCGSCGKCETTSSNVAPRLEEESRDGDLEQVAVLVNDAKANWREPDNQQEEEKWDLVFNDIGFKLARQNAASIKPLLAVFEEFGPRTFLDIVSHLLRANINGHLICWAFEYCNEDPKTFVKEVKSANNVALINFINQKAEFYSSFGSHTKLKHAVLYKQEQASAQVDQPNNFERDVSLTKTNRILQYLSIRKTIYLLVVILVLINLYHYV